MHHTILGISNAAIIPTAIKNEANPMTLFIMNDLAPLSFTLLYDAATTLIPLHLIIH